MPPASTPRSRCGTTPPSTWADFDLVVVRSCWDYMARREEFLAWAASVPHLANPADVLAWNTDKAYLRQLADAGVPVIPTQWNVATGDDLGAAHRVGGEAVHLGRVARHRPMDQARRRLRAQR